MVSKETPKNTAGASATNGETPPQATKATSKPARKPAAALPVKPRTKKPRESRMAEGNLQVTARVIAVQDDLVQIEAVDDLEGNPADLVKNEVVFVCPNEVNEHGEQERLKAEVLRVRGRTADAQVYEDTSGVAIGDAVEQSGEMLAVDLGPGLLGQVYDGLQNPLYELSHALWNLPAARGRNQSFRPQEQVVLRADREGRR